MTPKVHNQLLEQFRAAAAIPVSISDYLYFGPNNETVGHQEAKNMNWGGGKGGLISMAYRVVDVDLLPVVQVDIVALLLHDGGDVLPPEKEQPPDGESSGLVILQNAHGCKGVLPHVVYPLQESAHLHIHVISKMRRCDCRMLPLVKFLHKTRMRK